MQIRQSRVTRWSAAVAVRVLQNRRLTGWWSTAIRDRRVPLAHFAVGLELALSESVTRDGGGHVRAGAFEGTG